MRKTNTSRRAVVAQVDSGALAEAERSFFAALAALGQRRVLCAGTLLMRQFDPPGPMYVLQSGQVRVVRMQHSGNVQLASMSTGAYVGELSALLETPRNATAQALTETVVFEISVAQMRELIRTDPAFAHTIAENLIDRAGFSSTDAATLIREFPTHSGAA